MKHPTQLEFFSKISFFERVKSGLKLAIPQSQFRFLIQFSLGLPFLPLIFILIFYHRLPPQLPLLYSRPWGQEQLISTSSFIFIGLIYLILALINLFLFLFLLKKDLILAKVVISTTALISGLLTITLVKILILVI